MTQQAMMRKNTKSRRHTSLDEVHQSANPEPKRRRRAQRHLMPMQRMTLMRLRRAFRRRKRRRRQKQRASQPRGRSARNLTVQRRMKMMLNALRTRSRTRRRKGLRPKLSNPRRRSRRRPIPKSLCHQQHRTPSGRRRLRSATSQLMVVRLGGPFATLTTSTSRAKFRMARRLRRKGLELYQRVGVQRF